MLLKVPKRTKYEPFGWFLGQVIQPQTLADIISRGALKYEWEPAPAYSFLRVHVKFNTFRFQRSEGNYTLREFIGPA